MKWIKASERLPESDYIDTFFVKQRVKDSDEDWFPGTCTYSGEWEISDGYEVIEWLDESPEVVGESEKHAIMFATWVENNGYVRFDKYYWTNDECETKLSDDQLYHKFKTKT